MRTITKNVYEFKELSDKAREKAIKNVIMRCGYELTECDIDEIRSEIRGLCDVIGATDRWNGDYMRLRLTFPEDELEDMEDGMMRFIERNERIERKLYRSKSGAERLSYVICESKLSDPGWFHLAGVIDGMWKKRFEYVGRGNSVDDFLLDLSDEISAYTHRCINDCYSDYFVSDFIESNGMEFYEDGTPY